ncbi:MAG: hypothetical protein WC873_00615 [Candidatus Gracilibacteria bacterium]
MPQASKIALVKELIDTAESSLRSAKKIMAELVGGSSKSKKSYSELAETLPEASRDGNDKIVEGVFNGEIMTDKKGKEYPVPANYASKSKLVPGDVLKLTIKEDGSFVYKQIGPIARKRLIGTLTYEDGQYKVIANGKAYKVLLASVTYYKGAVGHKATIIIPELEDSDWAAIENVLPSDADDVTLTD